MLGEYKEVLRDAWNFTKNNPFLWWFGFFAAFLGGNGGEYEMLVRNALDLEGKQGMFAFLDPAQMQATFEMWREIFAGALPIFWVVALVAAIVGLFFFWVLLVSQAGLIHASGRPLGKRALTFDRIFSAGREFVGPTFLLNLLSKAVVLVALVILAIPAMFLMKSNPTAGWVMGYIVSLVVLVPGAILVSFLFKYALCYVILKHEPVGDAIRKSWELFAKNWTVTLEMALIIFGLNVLVGVAMVFILVLFGLPMVLLLSVVASTGLDPLFWIFFSIAAMVCFVIVAVLGAGFSTFQWSAWTMLFVELTKKRRFSMVVRWIKTLFPRTTERLEELAESQ